MSLAGETEPPTLRLSRALMERASWGTGVYPVHQCGSTTLLGSGVLMWVWCNGVTLLHWCVSTVLVGSGMLVWVWYTSMNLVHWCRMGRLNMQVWSGLRARVQAWLPFPNGLHLLTPPFQDQRSRVTGQSSAWTSPSLMPLVCSLWQLVSKYVPRNASPLWGQTAFTWGSWPAAGDQETQAYMSKTLWRPLRRGPVWLMLLRWNIGPVFPGLPLFPGACIRTIRISPLQNLLFLFVHMNLVFFFLDT
jgi:hypothetical protein